MSKPPILLRAIVRKNAVLTFLADDFLPPLLHGYATLFIFFMQRFLQVWIMPISGGKQPFLDKFRDVRRVRLRDCIVFPSERP